jgi:CubicO group peptidase (beta-lactamase class C family)
VNAIRRYGKAILILFIFSFFCGSDALAHEDEPHHPTSIAELEEGLREIMWEGNVPGISVAVVEEGSLAWAAGLGVTDREAGTRADASSVFRVGSVSKSFVSLAVMMLVEQGLLNLNDRLADLAPEIEFTNPWEAAHPVRLVHLLEHTTGFEDIHFREFAYQDPHITLRDGLAFNPRSRTSRWQPGLFFSYSNSGPAVAAYIVEKITGQRFEDFVRENIFIPLGMENTSFFLSPHMEQRLSKSYGISGGEIPYSHILVRPSGSASTTPEDMANLLIFLIERGSFSGQRLLQPETIDIIETPQSNLAAESGLQTGYAKGNFSTIHENFVFHGHDGGIDGFAASYGYLPEHHVGYYVSLNGGTASMRAVTDLISSYLTRQLDSPPPLSNVNLQNPERFKGYYEGFTPRMELLRITEHLFNLAQVEETQAGLVLRPLLGGVPQTLIPVAEGLYRMPGDPAATVAFAEHVEYGTVLLGMGGLGGSLRMAPGWSITGRVLVMTVIVLSMLSNLLYALVWVPLWLFRPHKRRPFTGLRLLPLLAVLSLLAAIIFLVAGFFSGIESLGTPSFWSVGFFLLTILFGILTLISVVQVVRINRLPETSRPLRIYASLVSLALLVALVYLAANGMVGLRTWV